MQCCQVQNDARLHGIHKQQFTKSSFSYSVLICFTQYVPPRDKTNKMSARPAETWISLGICPVWSIFTVRMKKAWILRYPLSAQKRLWKDCPVWSESLLGAQPHCWFCDEAAQFVLHIQTVIVPNGALLWKLGKLFLGCLICHYGDLIISLEGIMLPLFMRHI